MLGRTQNSAMARLEILKRQGHSLDLDVDMPHRWVGFTVNHANGTRYSSSVHEGDIPWRTRNGRPYRSYPQSVLIARAIHTACDWIDGHENQGTSMAIWPFRKVEKLVTGQQDVQVAVKEQIAELELGALEARVRTVRIKIQDPAGSLPIPGNLFTREQEVTRELWELKATQGLCQHLGCREKANEAGVWEWCHEHC